MSLITDHILTWVTFVPLLGSLLILTLMRRPQPARIFALADALDAITSHRPYRRRRSFAAARKEIEDNAGTQFDPEVVEAFCSIELDTWEKIRYETTRILPPMEDMMRASRPGV